MGDYIYAFSTAGVTVHRTEDMSPMVELEIPGYEPLEAYYYETEGEDDSESSVDPGEGDGEASSEESEAHPCNEADAENCED